jgi:cell division protein YceG involved in septum cleavage
MKKILKFILILIVMFIAYLYYSYNNFKSDILITETKIIEIKSGETIKNLSEKLNINSYFLKKYIKDTNSNFKLLV